MNPVARRGLCLVLAAPSGGGKTAIARRLVATEDNLELSISMTSRAPRAGEQDGVDYHFRPGGELLELAMRGGFLEWATVFERTYGTPRAPVDAALPAGRDMVFDIDWQGHRSMRRLLPNDVVSVFILPPSLQALEARLRQRGDGEPAVASRMARAREEISHWDEFDYVIVNTDLGAATEEVRNILRAARLERARQTGLANFVTALNA